MPIKKLIYPAGDSEQTQGSINHRLYIAHTHDNLDVLRRVDETTLNEIQKIKDKLDADLTGVSLSAFKQAAIDAGVAFDPPTDDTVIYGVKGGKFVSISDGLTPTEYTSKSLDISSNHTIELTDDTMNLLKSISSKMTKITGATRDGYLLTNTVDGDAQISTALLSDVLLKSMLSSVITDNSTSKIPTSSVTYELYQKLQDALEGGGTMISPVVNAFTQTTSGYAVSGFTLSSGGTSGYAVGDILSFDTGAIIPATFRVESVTTGTAIQSLSLVDGGFYENTPVGTNPVTLTCTNGRGATITVTQASTTLGSKLPSVDSVNEFDICCVISDERHNNDQSFYVLRADVDSGRRSWSYICSFPRASRDFIANPITLNEIAESAVTNTNLALMPALSVKANITSNAAHPADVSLSELLSNMNVVNTLKYEGELNSARRTGDVELSLSNFKLTGFARDTSTQLYSRLLFDATTNPINAFIKLQQQSDMYQRAGIGQTLTDMAIASDCNTVTANGYYRCSGNHAPHGCEGMLCHLNNIDGCTQLYWTYRGCNPGGVIELESTVGPHSYSHTWIRSYIKSTDTWTNWRVTHDGSIESVSDSTNIDSFVGAEAITIYCKNPSSSSFPLQNSPCIVRVVGSGEEASATYPFSSVIAATYVIQEAFYPALQRHYIRFRQRSTWSKWVEQNTSFELPEPLQIIANAGITEYDGIASKYPRSITPPISSKDTTIATTEFTNNAVTNAILPIQASISGVNAQLSAINSKLNLATGSDGTSLPYLTAGTYNIQLYPGTWQLECWGAQGGGPQGGLGGYARTTVVVTRNMMIYVVVGSQPSDSTGGFNGGGSSANYSGLGGNCVGYGGGGATHIALVDGVLSNLEEQKDKVLIVAGGGGGCYAGTNTSGNTSYAADNAALSKIAAGGCGGGLEGSSGSSYTNAHPGGGGTQTTGGSKGHPYSSTSNQATGERMYNPTDGAFGLGGNGNTISAPGYSPNHGGAGGGGWYGGGGASPYYSGHANYHTNTCYAGGGGGSGYVIGVCNSLVFSALSIPCYRYPDTKTIHWEVTSTTSWLSDILVNGVMLTLAPDLTPAVDYHGDAFEESTTFALRLVIDIASHEVTRVTIQQMGSGYTGPVVYDDGSSLTIDLTTFVFSELSTDSANEIDVPDFKWYAESSKITEGINIKRNTNGQVSTVFNTTVTSEESRCILLSGNQVVSGAIAGMPNPDKNDTTRIVGNSGNGMAKISYISQSTSI